MTVSIRDNREALPAVAATFRISSAQLYLERPHADAQGRIVNLPGAGGVALGLHSGMPVEAVIGDHAMPGISLEDGPATAHGLVCVGNRVRALDGHTAGVVAGKRGGLAPGFIPGQFIGVEAPDERLFMAVPGETLVIETYGRGLEFLDFPQLAVLNCSPRALD